MICNHCGNEIGEAAFCPHCGTVRGVDTAVQPGPEGPVPGSGKKKGLLIGGTVAVVAVVAVLIAVVSGMFSNPKSQLEKALGKSAAAYGQAGAAMGMPDLYLLTDQRSVSQRMSLRLNSVNSVLLGCDGSALSGLGLRMNTNLNGKARMLSSELGVFWGEDELASVLVAADDNELYFSSPQFTKGTAYGINTETLGADMEALGAEGVGNISFNLFRLMDIAVPEGQVQALRQTMKTANKTLWEAAEVKKGAGETLAINGTSTKAAGYQVIIPQEALLDYADAVKGVISSTDGIALYREMLEAAGMTQEQIDRLLAGLAPYDPAFDAIRNSVEEMGGLELTVYTGGGYVCAVRYAGTIQGNEVELSLDLGGGGQYVDDLSLELKNGSKTVSVKSSGDHAGKGGAFTDKTVLRYDVIKLTSDASWDPKSGNLQWELGMDSAGTLEMAGTLTAGKDTLDMKLNNISLRLMGMEIGSLGLDYAIGPCQEVNLPEHSPKLMGGMSEIERMGMMVNIQRNAEKWLNEMEQLFAQRLPDELYHTIF